MMEIQDLAAPNARRQLRHGRAQRTWATLAVVGVAPAALVTGGLVTATPTPAQAAATAAQPACATVGLLHTCTFTDTTQPYYWTVPENVNSIVVSAVGGAGGSAGTLSGGLGGGVTANLPTGVGRTLQISVGRRGGNGKEVNPARIGLGGTSGGSPSGGNSGGGWAGESAGGGGGASDVRLAPYGLANRAVVGAGGGGAGAVVDNYLRFTPGAGGNGGSPGGIGNGGQGGNVAGTPGAGGGGGGTATAAGGSGGASGGGSIYAGCGNLFDPAWPQPGSSGSGTLGGMGGVQQSAFGYRCDNVHGMGGGGGGGWFGGGGGGAGVSGGAGGGGGSSYGPPGSTAFSGQSGADGQVTISYLAQPQWTSLGGQIAADPTVAERPRSGAAVGVHDVVYLGPDRLARQRVVRGGAVGGEIPLGGPAGGFAPGARLAAVWSSPSRFDVVGRAPDGSLWQRTWQAAGGWGTWSRVALVGTPFQTALRDPAVVATAPDRLHLFVVVEAGQVDHFTSSAGGSWTRQTTPAGSVRSDDAALAAAVTPDGHIDLIVTDTRNGPRQLFWWRYADGAWTRRTTPISPLPVTSAPTFTGSSSRYEVAVRNESGGLSASLFNPFEESWTPLAEYATVPSPAGAAVALAFPLSSTWTGIVYARGDDGRLVARTLTP